MDYSITYRPRGEKTCLRGFANNTGTDRLAHPRILFSAFVIRYMKRIVVQLASCEVLMFYLVSVAEYIGLKLALSETRKTFFCRSKAHMVQ